MKTAYKRALIIGAVLISAMILFRILHIGDYLNLEQLRIHSDALKQLVERNYMWSVFVYIGIYLALIAVALPVVAPLTMLGGFVFGALPGLVYAEVGATLGSTVSFLVVRYVLHHVAIHWSGDRLHKFNERIKEYGYGYLLTLQLIMIVPFFVINTLAALANVPLITFMWTTAVGALPFLFVYAFAGRKLGEINSIKDILQPNMIILVLVLAVLALLPMLIRKIRKKMDV